MVVGELSLDRGCVFAGVSRIQRRKVIDHADVGYDHFEIVPAHDVPDQVFDLRDVVLGYFDSGARGNFQVNRELTGIGLREER